MKKWLIPSIMFLLCGLGLLTLRSVAPSLVPQQFVYYVLGGILFFFLSRGTYSRWESFGWLGYVIVIILLIIPLVSGTTTRGIAGWITVGSLFSIQPSQLAVPVVGLVVARYCAQHDLRRLYHLVVVSALILVPGILIVIEPDLGTTVVYLFSMGMMVFMSNISWRQIASVVSLAVIAIALSWMFVLKPYQKQRITSFLGTTHDPRGASYNARQSLIAVGSGQLLGRGLGQGVQSHLRFLPERQTDFIFASLSEELGFVGSVLVVGLYWTLIGWCLKASQDTPLDNARLYAIGCAAMLTLQCGVNIGMNMGLLPITGITLPLISAGGSSILATAGMLGILHTIGKTYEAKSVLHLT